LRYAGCASYLLIVGASFFLMFQVCPRCSSDNAYLGEVLLGVLSLALGLIVGLAWVAASRRDGRRGFVAGAIPGVAVAAVILAITASRTLVPPANFAVELVLLVVGATTTLAIARRRVSSSNP
jgi:hypothetical protein